MMGYRRLSYQSLVLIFTILICGIPYNWFAHGLSSNLNGPTGSGNRLITHRASAVFALMESMKRKNSFAIRILEQDPAYLKLDQRDRAFARLLLSTAERRSGQIERVVESFLRKGDKQKKSKRLSDILVDAALRIGAAQILFLDVSIYAAVSETVESLRMHPKINVSKSQISFVNAVLRNIDREGRSILESTSIIDNVDQWLANQWIQQYGRVNTELIVEAAMSQSPVFVTVNQINNDLPMKTDGGRPKSRLDQMKERTEVIRDTFTTTNNDGDRLKAELLPVGSVRIPDTFNGAISRWPLYEDGAWWVQDVSATLPAIGLFNTVRKDFGEQSLEDVHVVDLCSAPGGKTAQLCSMGFGRVDAIEFNARRCRALRDNLKRLQMEDICNVIVADGRQFEPDNASGPVLGVLVDAPCSASGVGSRRPDVLRKSIDVEELTSIQRDLFIQAVDNILDIGGVIVYATCSLLKQEGEDQVNWLLSENGSKTYRSTLETIPFVPGEIPGFDDCIDESGWLRVLPGVLPDPLKFCDGFFVARLRKTGG